MGLSAVLEPLVVVFLLFGGAYLNRNRVYSLTFRYRRDRWANRRPSSIYRQNSADSFGSADTNDALLEAGPASPSLLEFHEPIWQRREIRVFGLKTNVTSPNTRVFKDRLLSRLLLKFPFLVEAWYWALIYWVYQLGRAFTAVNLVEGTVHVARRHALQVIHLEKKLHIFFELPIQAFFLKHPLLLHWINRIYSFIHIPGTILFLVLLFYYTATRNSVQEEQESKDIGKIDGSPAGPKLYEARRRTMAVCNLLAFVVFTIWPCMPPRLLSDRSVQGPSGPEARSYGFVDTVHGAEGESSVWTQNRFCNQYAAMPSLHFGYALMIGLTVMTIPLAPRHRRSKTMLVPIFGRLRLPTPMRFLSIFLGFAYSFTILTAIVATANHFILDAVAGATVCGLGWWGNRILLNLLPLEDYFLWCVKIHKPERYVVEVIEDDLQCKVVMEEKGQI